MPLLNSKVLVSDKKSIKNLNGKFRKTIELYNSSEEFLGHMIHDSNNMIQLIYGYLALSTDDRIKELTPYAENLSSLYRNALNNIKKGSIMTDFGKFLHQSHTIMQKIDVSAIDPTYLSETDKEYVNIVEESKKALEKRLNSAWERIENRVCERMDVFRYNANDLIYFLVDRACIILSKEGFQNKSTQEANRDLLCEIMNPEMSRVYYHTTSDDYKVEGNAENLERIIENLIRNAKQAKTNKINFTISPSKSLMSNQRYLNIICRDYGVGMDSETLTRCSREGFTTKKDGNGFGLSSVKKYAQALNGNLYVSSSGFQHGTKVVIEMPIYLESQEHKNKNFNFMNIPIKQNV